MSELLNQLQPAMRAFFEAFLGHDERPTLQELYEEVGADLEITVGRHRPYGGSTQMVAGMPFLPHYAVHVEPKLVFFTGSGRHLRFFQEMPLPSRSEEEGAPQSIAPRVKPYEYSLMRVVERVDPRIDDLQKMKQLLADMRPPATWGTDADPSAAPPSGMGDVWADAVMAQRQADADAPEPAPGQPPQPSFETPLGQLQGPLPEMPDVSLEDYRLIMKRFFTYYDNADGDYYPKATQSIVGANGEPVEFPEGTTAEYRRLNVREVQLEPGTYCLVQVPDGWGSPTRTDRQVGRFREIVFEIRPGSEGGFTLHVVHWAARTVRWGDAPARDSWDFCFFNVDTTQEQRDEPPPEVSEMDWDLE